MTDDYVKQCSRINKKGERVYYYWCNPCNTERLRKYKSTKEGAEKTRQAVYRSVEKHKQKQNARQLLNWHLKNGKIKKPNKCEECDNKKVEAHHEDYSKPLDVIWLCRKCHSKKHK